MDVVLTMRFLGWRRRRMTSRVVVLRMDLAYGKRNFDVSRVMVFPGKKKEGEDVPCQFRRQ